MAEGLSVERSLPAFYAENPERRSSIICAVLSKEGAKSITLVICFTTIMSGQP